MNGSCFCGAVRFEVRQPIPNLYQCHCSMCRKVTGAAANAAFVVPKENFAWLAGESLIKSYSRPTGYRNDFCAICGSSLPNKLDSEETVWIPAGLLDGPTFSTVAKHFFVGSKADWDDIGGKGVQYEELPIKSGT